MYKEAIDCYDQAISINPSSKEVMYIIIFLTI